MALNKSLAKLTILVETGEAIEVLFNPNQIAIQKTANWREAPMVEGNVPESQYTYGDAAILTLELFFDTYEVGTDVREHTNAIFALTTVNGDLHRPPLCELAWGMFDFTDFQWVLQSLNQRFTLFLADGTPVRATLGCTFKQWRSNEGDARRQGRASVDVAKTRTVRRGDTLSSIASEEYKDATLWRPIAQANRIDNPRVLKPGQVLSIPALRSPSTARR